MPTATLDPTMPVPFLDGARLMRIAAENAAAYQSTQPFPHSVIDGLLPTAFVERLIHEFPKPEDIEWRRYKNARENKLATSSVEDLGAFTRLLLAELNSVPFLTFLEHLTGIEGLIPDPYLLGGGLHQLPVGGMLKVHADFNWHQRLKLHRRLNALIYLNPDWDEAYGGHLELWNREMTECVERILPVSNRCVVFTTSDSSFHGNPEPVTCPPGRSRRSIALYYYTSEPAPEGGVERHSTVFRARPGEQQAIEHEETIPLRARLSMAADRWVPPVALEAARELKRRAGTRRS
jgi:hypothetical protein